MNGLTVLSLLLCFAAVVLWARSGIESHQLVFRTGRTVYMVVVSRLGIQYFRVTDDLDATGRANGATLPNWSRGWHYKRQRDGGEGAGMAYRGNFRAGDFAITHRYWFIIALTSTPTICELLYRRRRARYLAGLCPNCRYDLRATPDRCPECGPVPARAAEKTRLTTENTEHTEKGREDIAADEDR